MARILVYIFTLALAWIPGFAYGYGQPLNLTPAQNQALLDAQGKIPGEVVFASLRDGKWRLFRINADGSGLSRLSLGPANYRFPTFILHGSQLIYHSDENGPEQIFIAQPDLSQAACLSPAGVAEQFAGLSQQNLMLLYRPAEGSHYLRPLAGGEAIRIILPEELALMEGIRLYLAPNGSRLLATVKAPDSQHGQAQMYILTLNPLTGHSTLYQTLGSGDYGAWRGDSEALLFVRAANFDQAMGTTLWFWEEGGQGQQLSDDLSWNIEPAFALGDPGLVWSKAPLFTSDRHSGRYDIWLQREHGQTLRLTWHSAPDVHPTWRLQRSRPLHQNLDFIYDARQYATFRGTSVPDTDAPGGQALESVIQPGLLVSTAPEMVPSGWYQARFRLKLTGGLTALPPDLPLARLEVVSQSGQKVLASEEVTAENFTGQGYNLFPLPFTLQQLNMGLQLNIYTLHEQVRVRTDTIFLQSDAPAPWYAPVME